MKNQHDLWGKQDFTAIVPAIASRLLMMDHIFQYGQAHGFPERSFNMSDGGLGDYRCGIILPGEAQWKLVYQCADDYWLKKAYQEIREAR